MPIICKSAIAQNRFEDFYQRRASMDMCGMVPFRGGCSR